jgi:hypothetical protein
MSNYKVCICGGGSLGHVIAGYLVAKSIKVNVLTTKPALWSNRLTVTDLNGKIFCGNIDLVTDDAKKSVEGVDLLLFCLPGNIVKDVIKNIWFYVSPNTIVGSVVGSNGFFWIARKYFEKNQIFAFQRVPFISRTLEYGHSALLKGYKKELKIGYVGDTDKSKLCRILSDFFDVPVKPLSHYLEAAITNSNPILHPCRLYSLLVNKIDFDEEPYFYESWDNKSSQILVDCDNEFQKIILRLGLNKDEIPSLLNYYESKDVKSLTKKIQSIEAFKNIKLKMTCKDKKYYPNYNDRYFIEDIPFGLVIVKSIAELLAIPTPSIDIVLNWAQTKMNKSYLVGDKLVGRDIVNTGALVNFDIDTVEKLLVL